MNISVSYNSIIISTISDENIEKCVDLRDNQATFFFGQNPDKDASYKWVKEHRYDVNDILLQIIYKDTGTFIGTIGMVKRGRQVETGRLALDPNGAIELLKQGISREQIGDASLYACLALLRLVVEVHDFDEVFATVRGNNALSNKLCRENCDTIKEDVITTPKGDKEKVYIYSFTREEIIRKYGKEKMVILLA